MAIQIAVPSSPVEHHEKKQAYRRGRVLTDSGRSRVCPGRRSPNLQSRGPSHDGIVSNNLAVKLLPLVKRVALQIWRNLPAHVELDDLIGEGTLGLIDAVRKFDPAKGVTIESYARYRIRGAILDSLRRQDHASRDMRRKIKRIESTCQKLELQLGRPAEDAELAEAMGLSLAKWYERLSKLQRVGFEGPGSGIFHDGSNRISEVDLLTDSEKSAFARCYRQEQKALLSRALRYLVERDRTIINLYYHESLTMKQIGARLGIDESRVSQLHSCAVARLRSKIGDMVRKPA